MDMRHPHQRRPLVGNQCVAANARRREILLHCGIFGVIALDGAGMVTRFDDANELIETGSRWHQSLLENLVAGKAAPSTAAGVASRLCRAAALPGGAADGSVGKLRRLSC